MKCENVILSKIQVIHPVIFKSSLISNDNFGLACLESTSKFYDR